MTTTEPTPTPSMGGPAPGIVDRAKNILLQPKAEWERIATENTSTQSLFMGYALPLVVLSALCGFVGYFLFLRWGIMLAIVPVAIGIVMQLIAVFIMGFVINALAPSFGSTPSPDKAQRLAVYSQTPAWLAGCLAIFPPLAPLAAIGGLYGLYVLYQGLGPMMSTPEDKRIVYIVVLLVIAFVIFATIAWITMMTVGMLTVGAVAGAAAVGGYGY